MRSLKNRAIVGGAIGAVISVAVGGAVLLSIFDSIANDRFNGMLQERHLQVVVALANSDAEPEIVELLLTDPAYSRPYSGRYWQINGPDDALLTSRSLFDTMLDVPAEVPGEPMLWSGPGPDGSIRGVRQKVELEDGSEWIVTVAESVAALNAERGAMVRSVGIAFGFVGIVGLLGAALLTSAILRPLSKLREDVAHRWDAGRALEVEDYPAEVAPLVTDINDLLVRNADVLGKARRQAADLAHALKTPSAALRNDLEAMAVQSDDARRALAALDRIDAQIGRSLARMRASQSASAALLKTDLGRSADRLMRLFRSMRETEGKDVATRIAPGTGVAMDAQDIEEILGNLLENAVKWCRHAVSLSATQAGNTVRIEIEDDGPGIPEDSRRTALTAGGRLDTKMPGTGLGLAIAKDLVEAYGGTLELATSDRLGGLAVRITVPAAKLDDADARLAAQ